MAKKKNSGYQIKQSKIHGRGIFATRDYQPGERILQYLGEKISKKESERRATRQLQRSKDHNEGAVYIFILDEKWDIDGNFEYNDARYLNHSCRPNCEVINDKNKLWITALTDIKAGQELYYNYGYDLECWEDHPCYCGEECCPGYIVAEEYWKKLRRILKRRRLEQTVPDPREPRLEIRFCPGCRWQARACWVAQELLTTFKEDFGEVALMPSESGTFDIYLNDKLVFSRREKKRFPELKELKQAILPLIESDVSLGHSAR